MQYLQSLLDNSNMPIFTAFLLGTLTALSPCPLATNITAIGYISKDIESKHRIFLGGIFYTLGRIITYTTLGLIIIPILRQGASAFNIEKSISKYGEMLIFPALILIGLFMLLGNKLNLPKFAFVSSDASKLKNKGFFKALLLGIMFSLAFCPTSGVFYFGMLLPISVAEQEGGYLLPIVFAIATSLPVIVIAWILAYSVSRVGKFYNRTLIFQKWVSRIIALLFIAVGVYYTIIFYI